MGDIEIAREGGCSPLVFGLVICHFLRLCVVRSRAPANLSGRKAVQTDSIVSWRIANGAVAKVSRGAADDDDGPCPFFLKITCGLWRLR
jgi:hypothetical protein